MGQKFDKLHNEENTGRGLLGTVITLAVSVVGYAIRNAYKERAAEREIGAQRDKRDQRSAEIQAEIEQLKIQRNHYENELFGKLVYSDEIDAINRKIASLADELRRL